MFNHKKPNWFIHGSSIKFQEMQTNIDNQDKAKSFWQQNEIIKKQLNSQTNFNNRGFMAQKADQRRINKAKLEKFMDKVIEKGFDEQGELTLDEFLEDYYQQTGFILVDSGDGYNYKWIQSKVPKTFMELMPDSIRKVMKYTGTDFLFQGMDNIVKSGETFYNNPNLENAIDIGTTTGDLVKSGINAYKNPQAVLKQGAMNIAEDVL